MIDFALNMPWLIPILPAIAFVLIVFIFKPLPKISAFISIVAIFLAFLMSVSIGAGTVLKGAELVEHPLKQTVTWFAISDLKIEVGSFLDPTTAMMLIVVTLVALLVQIYSIGYMHGDYGFARYYAFISLFAASMLGLVISPNLLQMFVFWELVGLCSYLLIGFWYNKVSAREAAKKAFITTRTGDFGLLLGILLLQINFGTLDLQQLSSMVPNFTQYTQLTAGGLTAIAILLFLGPIGKSGQFPLHVWLPDAMEGPTPVSALIHAATMVVAGVYLVGRTLFLFKTVPYAMAFVAAVGAFTALFAALIAITQTEMKRVLAYSTVSQLGYMMLALGTGSLTAGMFHLMTHAFFKALMFLGAGSVLHAMHDQVNIWKYGGLRKYMPVTYGTFLIGCLAIAGIFPFAGFFSKDLILEVTWAASGLSGHGGSQFPVLYSVLFVMAALTALLTAFYMFRMFIICFHGELRDKESHPHESPFTMILPMLILAVLSIGGGLVGWPGLHEGQAFGYFVRTGEFEMIHANWTIIIISTVGALIGIGAAVLIYGAKVVSHEALAEKLGPLYRLSYNKFYIDEIYLWIIHNIIDGLGKLLWWVDVYIIDGIVNGLGKLAQYIGGTLRRIQTGNLQHYALLFFVGIVLVMLVLGFSSSDSISLSLIGGGM